MTNVILLITVTILRVYITLNPIPACRIPYCYYNYYYDCCNCYYDSLSYRAWGAFFIFAAAGARSGSRLDEHELIMQ